MSSHNNNNSIPDTGEHVPEDVDQKIVVTPYGKGLVLRTRPNGMREIELRDWKKQPDVAIRSSDKSSTISPQSSDSTPVYTSRPVRPATLYSATPFPSVTPQVGSDVICRYGRGRVTAIRGDDNNNNNDDSTSTTPTFVVVRLSSWRLARRSTVTCYLRLDQVQVVRPKLPYEMSVVEKVEHATELKQIAAHQFQHERAKALQTYSRAVDIVKFVQHRTDSNNAVRADLVVVMITCSNNAATCCAHLQQWDTAQQHAQHATALIEALERKVHEGKSYIHQELLAVGYTDRQVFGEWKVKSLLVTARALLEKGDVPEAMEVIKSAREAIAQYTNPTENQSHASVKQLQRNDKELVKLWTVGKERRKAQLKKERLRAQAMFGSIASLSANERATSPSEEEKKTDGISPSMPHQRRPSSLKQPQSSDAASSHSPRTVMTMTNENREHDERTIPVKKRVSFADETTAPEHDNEDDDDRELVWHQDPAFLGGLGVVIGVVGTLLVLSQVLGKPKK